MVDYKATIVLGAERQGEWEEERGRRDPLDGCRR